MKYIDADKLIAEIERLEHENCMNGGEHFCMRRAICLGNLRGIITPLRQEQPDSDYSEFEKALDEFGEAYATLVDRDNNPNQGIGINSYHKLVQENISRILELAKEYAKQAQPEVDLEEEIDAYLQDWEDDEEIGIHLSTDFGDMPIEIDDIRDLARHFYELGKNSK